MGQKVKLPKTCEKRLYKHIRVVVCKKGLEKTVNIQKINSVLKMAKNGHQAKAIAHAKYSVWVKKKKLPKTCEKRLYKHIRVVLWKKRLEKTVNIRKTRAF